ncbi:MAG: serine/threonine-protein kinase [Fuerstiella sp.]
MKTRLEQRNQIDELCDRFEESWPVSATKVAGELLQKIDEGGRPELLCELITIHRERCLKSKTEFLIEDFRALLPNDSVDFDQLQARFRTDDLRDAATATKQGSSCLSEMTSQLSLGDRIDSYELKELLGQGGMSAVYRATDSRLNREVALKIVASSMADAVPRMQAEARMIASLDHAHIVQVFGTGTWSGGPYLALELVDGGSLDVLLSDELLTARRSAEIVIDIAEAVSAAHESGLIHRDLKPANVLMTTSGVVKLADFGLSRDLNLQSQTISGALLGTPGYMSPEQTTGSRPTTAIDVYGLGGILYACLTGRPPFRGANIPDTLTLIRNEEPVPVRRLAPSTPVDLESICQKCLSKDPLHRYASAADLRDDLAAFLEGRSVKARPVSLWTKALRFSHRNPVVVSLATCLCVALVAGVSGIIVQWQRAESNAVAYQEQFQIAEEKVEAASALQEFMRSVLGAAQAAKTGEKTDISDAIAAALPRVDEAFYEHPEIEAAVRETLGKTLRTLEQATVGIEQYRRSIELYEQVYGRSDFRTLHAIDGLAGIMRSLGNHDQRLEAIELRKFVLSERIRQKGEFHFDSISAMDKLSAALGQVGEFDEVERLTLKAMAALSRLPNGDDRMAESLQYNLAGAYWQQEKLAEARSAFETLIERMSRRIEAADPDSIFRHERIQLCKSKGTLALIVHDLGDVVAAEGLYRELLPEFQELEGLGHRRTLSVHRRLVRLLIERKKFEDALPFAEQLLQQHSAAFGPAAGLTLEVRRYLVSIYQNLKRIDRVEQFLRETVALTVKHREPGHDYIHQAKSELDQFLANRQDVSEALNDGGR